MSKLTDEHLQEIISIPGYKEISCAIETGTYTGNATLVLCEIFKIVHTIELAKHYYDLSHQRLSEKNLLKTNDKEGVITHLGDSVQLLREISQHIHAPVLFYLDAHWWDSSIPDRNIASASPMPLWSEIEAINLHSYDDIIVVDNIHAFNGKSANGINDLWIDVNQKNIKSHIDNVVKDKAVADMYVLYTKTK